MRLLQQLAAGNADVWDEAFHYLYPVAFEAARSRLGGALEAECEDVAIESLSDILEKSAQVSGEEELKPFVAAIARNKATDRLRRFLAEKRGGNQVQSLDVMLESSADEPISLPDEQFLDQVSVQEVRALLTELSSEVKHEYRIVLRDHFFDELSYREIAEKRRISIGSVGVYVQRALASLRTVIARRPKLRGEFLSMISDATAVKLFLPMIWAVQLGGWFPLRETFASPGRGWSPHVDDSKSSDEDRLQQANEVLPDARTLTQQHRSLLLEKLKTKFPSQVEIWEQKQEDFRLREAKERRRDLLNELIARSTLIAVGVALLYGVIRLVIWLV